jgi:hypothetical protein
MHGAHAAPLQHALEAQVEIGRIDADQDRNALGEKPARDRAARAVPEGARRLQ